MKKSLVETDREKDKLLRYTIELERELTKMKRAEKVLHEMERRYLALMDSDVFLHVILALDGTFRMMNRRAEEFFGFQSKFGQTTLQSLSGPGYRGEVEVTLKDALTGPVHVPMPVVRADGTLGWLDMEFFSSVYQGEPSIQIIASDITDLMKGKPETALSASLDPEGGAWALGILNGCPGLSCFAVDKNKTLLYFSQEYQKVARRFLGHQCQVGSHYPSGLATAFDIELQELVEEALSGSTRTAVLVERMDGQNNRWNVTATPLTSSGDIEGAVVSLTWAARPKEREGPPLSPKLEKDRAEEARASLRELLNAIPRVLFLVDDEARCVEANEWGLNALKLNRDAVVGHPLTDLMSEENSTKESLLEKLTRSIRGNTLEGLELRVCTQEGEVLFLELRGTRLGWGTERLTLVSCADNTKLRRTEEQLKRMSTTDASTGILNRQGMERVLNTEIQRASRYRGSLTLIVLDVDGFRSLNERVGYAASDQVLGELSAALKSHIRLTDFLGRWGGDEFMILTPLPLAPASQLAEKLCDMVEHNLFGENVSLTLSLGVAEYRKPMDVPALVAAAYDAMTEAKRSGGNRAVLAREMEAQ